MSPCCASWARPGAASCCGRTVRAVTYRNRVRSECQEDAVAVGVRGAGCGGGTPTPPGKHAGVVKRVRRQLEGMALPDGLDVYEVSSIAPVDASDDYVTPSLILLPTEWEDDDGWFAAPEDTAFAVEVVSPSEKSQGIRDKVDWYAVARVPLLLVIDPRKATWALHSRPDNGTYQDVLPGKFGEPVPLPEPFGAEVGTGDFPVYGDAARPSNRGATSDR
ncbi:Uma2 family endonuclease [Streptomyces sp. NPDC002076]